MPGVNRGLSHDSHPLYIGAGSDTGNASRHCTGIDNAIASEWLPDIAIVVIVVIKDARILLPVVEYGTLDFPCIAWVYCLNKATEIAR